MDVVLAETFSRKMLLLENTLGNEVDSAGSIVFVGLSDEYLFELVQFEGRSLRQSPGEVFTNVHSSPDRSTIALFRSVYGADGQLEAQDLIVANILGEFVAVYPRLENWGAILGWTQGHLVVIASRSGPADAVVLLNPKSGETEQLAPGLPGVYDNSPPPQWDSAFPVRYDPTLTRAAYLRDPFDEDGVGVELWDLENAESIWELDGTSAISATPRWSDDGSRLAFAEPLDSSGCQYELSIVSHQGEVSRVTDLASSFDDPVRIIRSISWSPNAQKIAIVLDLRLQADGGKTTHALLVADLAAGTLTEYELPDEVGESLATPVWSPDSQHLALEVWEDPNSTQAILVDLATLHFLPIARGAGPVAWLIPQP